MQLIAVEENPITMLRNDTLELTINIWGEQLRERFIADKSYEFTRLETYLLSEKEKKILEVDFDIYTEGYDKSGNVIRVSQSRWSGKPP